MHVCLREQREVAQQASVSNPRHLITKDVLQATLKNRYGQEYMLVDYEVEDFLEKGDNYSSLVTSISCQAKYKEICKRIFYVAKLNPLREHSLLNEITNETFVKEGSFLTELSVKLNEILKNSHLPTLRIPSSVYSDFTEGGEMLLLEDLREKGFIMIDRRVGMSFSHSKVVCKELAKLHASSKIFLSKLQGQAEDAYPYLTEWIGGQKCDGKSIVAIFIRSSLDNAVLLIKNCKDYERQMNWLQDNKEALINVLINDMTKSSEKMKVICHGDLWSSNILFRYNDEGNPEEAAFVDFQGCHLGSVATDLNYYFYTSITGEARKKEQNQLLTVYFNQFEEIMQANKMPMPFTQSELREEILNYTQLGVTAGLMMCPAVILESACVPDMDKLTDDNFDGFMNGFAENMLTVGNENDSFKTRFLSIFDDILEKIILPQERGIFSA